MRMMETQANPQTRRTCCPKSTNLCKKYIFRELGDKLSEWRTNIESETDIQKSDDKLKDYVRELNQTLGGNTLKCTLSIRNVTELNRKDVITIDQPSWGYDHHCRERWTFPLPSSKAKIIKKGFNLKLKSTFLFKLGFCPYCRGSGRQACPKCNGRGYITEKIRTGHVIPGTNNRYFTYSNKRVKCGSCDGTGKKTCCCSNALSSRAMAEALQVVVNLRSSKLDRRSALFLATTPRIRCYIVFDTWSVSIADEDGKTVYEASSQR